MKKRLRTPTEIFIDALKKRSASLNELRIYLDVQTDATRYHRLKVDSPLSPCMGYILNPILHYLVNDFRSLDPESKELEYAFSEYKHKLQEFILGDLIQHLPGSKTPDNIFDSLNRCYEVLNRTMFNPDEPKAQDKLDELCELFNKASDEMREQIGKNRGNTNPQLQQNRNTSSATKGYTQSIHRGATYRGVTLCDDGQRLIIKGRGLKFTGVKQWEILDRIVDAHFADKWAKITNAEYKQFTTASGKELKANYLDRKRYTGHKKGNTKFSWEVRFKVN